MSKKFKIIVNTGNADNNQSVEVTQGQGGRGQPVRLQAKAGAKYQLLDLEKAKAVGPDYVKVKRVGKHLHILFEGSNEADVIIENYYDVMPEGYNGVVGQAENGNFYEYIPEDPDVKGLIPQLADGGQAVSVALGGAEVVGSGAAVAVLAFNPLLGALGLLGAGAAAAAAGGGGGATPVTGQKTALAIDPISTDNIITVSEGNATNILVTGRVTGVFKEGDVVELVVNNKTYAASVKADGTFSVPVAMADLKADADTKIDGSINGTGGDRGTASQDYQVLTQGGPTTTALAIDPVTGDNVIGAAENTGNIAVTGKVSGLFSAGDVVTLIVNGKTFMGVAAANGGFSINVPAADLVADADTKLEGRVTGTGGTAADAFQDYALADNITPITSKTALRLNAVTADNVISASENTGAIAISGTVSGTFAAGDVVTLTVNGKNFTGAAAANGTFSINVPAADLVADSDTMIEARVTGTGGDTVNAVQDYSTNLDGNNSDKTALAIDPISGDNIITVTEGNASSLLVTGRVTGVFKEGDVVSLVLNNKNYAATVNADGTFSVPVSMADLKADADTQIEGSIAGTGGSTAKAAQDYQVLTQGGPAVTALAIDPVTADNIIAASENVGTIAVTGRVSGAFSAGDIVTLVVNGKNFTGTAASTGAFSINVPAADLVADSDTAVEGRVSGTGGTTANAIQDYALDSNINPAPQDNKTALAINPITGDNVITATEGNATNITVTGKVTGAFRAGDVVTLVLNNKNITTTAAADGTFSVSVLSTDLKADADTQIEGSVTGTDGSAAKAAQDYTVEATDTPTQTALSINPVTADNIINAAESGAANTAVTGTVSGKFAAGDVVTLTVNGKTFTGTAAANGTFSINVPTADLIADSDTAVQGRVTGTGGTAASALQDYAVDTTVPTATVTLDKLTPDNIISAAEAGQANLPVTGTVTGDFKPGDVVTVQVNGKPFTTTVQANGSFSVNVPTADLLADPDKKYEVSVALTDSAGNTGTATASNTYTDGSATPVGVKTALSLDPITGDNVITSTEGEASSINVTGKVTGKFAEGDVVSLSLNGKNYAVTVAANGTFSIPVSMSDFKLDSDTKIEARISGTGGDTATAAQDYTVETSNTPTQTALSINPVTADNVLSAAETTGTIAITGTVSGKFAAGDVVTLSVNGKTFTGTATSNGSYSINVPAADLAADSDTKIEGSVSGAGGTTATAVQDYALEPTDNSNNKVAISLDPVTGDNIISTTEGNNSTTTLGGKVTGSFTAGDVVTLSLNNKTFTTTVASNGTYSISVATTDLKADADTKAEVSVSATSGGVDRTATNSQDYSVETSAGTGVALSVDTVTADNIINAAESGAANTAVTGKVTGTFASGDVVTLTINNKTFTGAVNAQGNYSISVPTTDLVADSDTQVDARITTSAGSATAIQNYAVNTQAPTATVTLDKLTPDNIISAAEAGQANLPVTGTVTGDFKPGDVVTVQVNGKPFTTTVQANGSFSVNVPTADLVADPDTKYEVSVALTDSAGNTGTATAANDYDSSVTPTPTNDKTALAIDPISGDNIISVTEGNATSLNVTGKVTGAFKAGDVVTLSLNNKTITTTAGSDGSFSVAVSMAELKADADTKIEGSVTGTGGSAASSSQDYQVLTADNATSTTALSINPVTADNIINAAESGAANTAVTGTVSGKFAAGDVVTLTVNGKTFTGTAAANGTFSINVPTADLIADSDTAVEGRVTGTGGSAATASQDYAVDTTVPTATVTLDKLTPDNIISAAEAGQANLPVTGTVTGDFKPGDVVTVQVNGKPFTTTVQANGSFSVNVPTADLVADPDTKYEVSVALTDSAGNTGTATGTNTYTDGSTTPVGVKTALSLDPITGDNVITATEGNATNITVTGKVTGTFAAGDVVTLVVNSKNITTTAAADGSFSVSVLSTDLKNDADTKIEGSVTGTGGSAATAAQDYTVESSDTPTQTALSINPVTADNIINAAESGAANTAVTGTVSGKFAAGDVVTLTVNGKTFTGTAVANGTFSINVPTADLIADSDTAVDGRVTGTGGTAAIASQDYAVDTTVPTTTVDITAISEDTGTSSSDFITKDNNGLTISATLSTALATGEKLFYSKDNGVTWTDITGSVTGTAVSHIDGTLTSTSTIRMQVRDGAGNAGATDSQLITIDTVAPAPVVNPEDPLNPPAGKASITVNDVTADNNVDATEGAASAVAVTGTVRGEFKAGDVVTLTINGKIFTGTAAANGTFSINVPGAELRSDSDKTINASVAATDVAGNVGNVSTTKPYSADNITLTTTVDITAISADSGTSATDFITNDNDGLTISATLSTALTTGQKLFYSKDNGVTWTDITGSVSGTAVSHIDGTLTSTSTIRMRVQDGSGNVGATDSQLVTIDTVAPAPVVNPEDPLNPPAGKASITVNDVTADNIVNTSEGAQSAVTVTGTVRGEFKTGDVVTLTINNKTFTGTAAANGTFSINVPGADLLADADKTIAASVAATDVTGNVGTVTGTKVYTTDTTAPTTTVDITAISLDSGVSASDFITNDNNGLTISATLSTGLTSGEKLFYSKDNGVTWTDITGSVSGTAVSHADSTLTSTSTIRMQVRNAAGSAGATDSQLIIIDTVAPAPVVNPEDPLNPPAGKASLTIDAITTDNVVNAAEGAATAVAITGTARGDFTAGDVVTLTVNAKTFTGSVAADGKFSINVPGSDLLADADKTVDASLAAKDKAGNVGTVTDTQVYTTDTTAPTTTVDITAISLDSGVSSTDFITNDNNGLTISATLSTALASGEKLFYSKDNGVTWTDITASVSGTAVSHADSTLTSTSTIQMRVQDGAGNAGAADSQLVTIDTVAPAPVVNPEDPLNPPAGKASLVLDSITTDNIVSAAEGAQANVAVTGTARGDFTAGDVVTLTVNSKTFTGSVAANGTFSINVPGADLLADADKTVDASLAAKDKAGNVGTVTDTQVYTADTTGPTTTVDITAISLDSGTSATDFITNDNDGLTISATLSASLLTGEKLFYSKDNGTTWTDITGSVSGTVVTHTDGTLTSTNTIRMQVRDAVGNAGATDSQLITIDTVAPAPVVNPEDPLNPPAGKASITVNDVTSDNIVNTTEGALSSVAVTGTVRGEFKAGDVVTLTINNKTFTGTAAANGSFSINVPGSDLLADADKTIAASVAATDVAGNVGAVTGTKVYSTDSTAPTTTVDITAISLDSGTSASDFITNDNNGLTISATLSTALATGEKLFYSKDNGVTWTDITASVSGGGTGTSVSHADSTLTSTSTIRMQVRDAAGNAGATDTQLITIDTVAPAPVVNPEDPLNPPAGKASLTIDSITTDNIVNTAEGAATAVAVTGTARGEFKAGDVVTLTVNSKTFTGTVAANGSFSINVPGSDLLADADKTVEGSLAATDVAGNVGNVTGTKVYTADTTAPTTTVDITAISLDSGVSSTDFITNDNNGLTISATLSAALASGEKLFYSKDNGVTWTDITASVSGGGTGTSVSHADSTLTSTSTIQMQVRDAAGNAGAADSQLVTIDTVAPAPVVNPEDPLNPPAGKASLTIDSITTDNVVNAAEGAQTSIAITGTARGDFTTGDVVTLTVNAKTFTGSVAANGTFSINVPGSDLLADADKTVEGSLAAKDKAGNVGTVTDTQVYTADTTGPTTTVDITAISLDSGVSATDFITNDNNGLTISATLSASLLTGEKLFYSKDNGTTWTDITGSVSGTVVSHVDGTLTSTSTIQMRVQDGAGNNGAADSQLVTIDTVAPAPVVNPEDPLNPPAGKASLVLDAITADNIVNITEGAATAVAITGTARGDFTTGDVVTLTVNAKTFTGSVAANGTFSINVPGADLLADGDKTVDASLAAKDKAGNVGTVTDTQVYTTDTTAPTTTVDITAISLDSGTAGDFITNDNNGLTISATLSAALATGEKLFYSKDNGTTWTDITASVSGGGTGTSVSHVDSTLTSTSTIRMQVRDAADNAGATDSQLITIDTVAPAPVVNPEDPLNPPAGKASLTIDSITTDNIVNTAEGAASAVAVTGTARGEFKAGDVVTLTVNAKTFTGSVAANGTFSINVPGSDLLADADKTVEGSLAATDVAGNVGNVTDTQVYTADTTAPTTTVDITAISLDSGTSATDFITNDNNGLTISATLSASLLTGEKLFYSKDNGTTWTDITGSVSGTVVTHTDSTLTSTSTIQMRVQDGAGNAGAADSQLVTIDTVAPAPVVNPEDPLNPPAGKASITVDSVTSDNLVNIAEGAASAVAITGTVRGEFKAGDVVTLTINSKTFTGTAAANGTFSINVPGSDLLADADKTIGASLAATDVAGNVGNVTGTKVYTTDNTAPTTTVDITAITDDTGVSGTDFVTKDNNGLTISATLSAALATGEKLFYSKDNGTTWTDITASVSGGGTGTSVSHADSTLTSTSTIQMQVRDAAGNAGASDSQLVTIDTSAPTNADVGLALTISSDANNDGTVSDSELNSATTFTTRVSVNSNAKVGDTVVINASNGSTALTAITRVLTSNDISNGFDVTFNTPAVDVTQTVTANYVDAAGNAATDTQPTDSAKLGASNTAPVANPTSVQNAFVASTGPEVTITDSVSAATVANSTDVTFTLTFSEAIKASTLTEADLSVTNGTLKAGTLTKVSDTVWTVQATSASTGGNSMALTLAEGSYTNNAGVAGDGGTGVQAVGPVTTAVSGAAIDGVAKENAVPTNWTRVSSSPDIYAEGATTFTYAGAGTAAISNLAGQSLSGGGFAVMLGVSTTTSTESISTTLSGLTVGETYKYGVQWQQFTLTAPTWSADGGQLVMTIGNQTQVFTTTSSPADDTWTLAVMEFTATATTATVTLKANDLNGAVNGATTTAIAVDSLTTAQIDALAATMGKVLTGTTGADTLVGTDNADTITAAGGADKIFAGAGDDKVTINESNVTALSGATAMVIDGGTGVNTLTLANTSAAATIDMTNATVADRLKNFSSIDLTGTQANTLKLDWKSASALATAPQNLVTGAGEILVVNGNAGDNLNLAGLSSWIVGTSQDGASLSSTFGTGFNFVTGKTYTGYSLNGVTVYVNDAITTSNLAGSAAPVTNAKTVQELFGPSFTDVESVANGGTQTFKGVAIVSAGTSDEVSGAGRHYEFSNDGGSTWTTLPAGLTDGTAVFLAPTALIRFVDSAGAAAPLANVDLKARLVDSSGQTGTASITSGATVDASVNGGTTAFSGSPVVVGMFNVAPEANPTSVTNAFAATTGPEVTITDNAPGAAGLFVTNGSTVAQGVVRFTLSFSESINASSLTESDLTVSTGGTGTGAALVAGSLTRVGVDQWTVDVKMPTTGAGTVSVGLADGSYTSSTGASGQGTAGTQWYGSVPVATGTGTVTAGANEVQTADSFGYHNTTAVLSNGNFVVPYYKSSTAADGYAFVRIFKPDGSLLTTTSSSAANISTTAKETEPKVIATSDGGFILAWLVDTSANDATVAISIWGQKFDANGVAVGSNFQIASDQRPWYSSDSPASNSGYVDWTIQPLGNTGKFAVSYTKSASTITFNDRSTFDVVVKLFDANNNLLNTQTLGDVETANTADTSSWLTAVGNTGQYVVSWMGTDSTANGGDRSLFVQKFNSDGSKLGSPSKLEATGINSGTDYREVVTSLGTDGSFAVTWLGVNSAGYTNVYTQRYDATGAKVGNTLALTNAGATDGIGQLTVTASNQNPGQYWVNWSNLGSTAATTSLQQATVKSDDTFTISKSTVYQNEISSSINRGSPTVISDNGDYAYVFISGAGLMEMYVMVFDSSSTLKYVKDYTLTNPSTFGASIYNWGSNLGYGITRSSVDGEFFVRYEPFAGANSTYGVLSVSANSMTNSITGTTAVDTLITGEYDDTITAAGGADIIRTGAGNDKVIINTDNVAQLANTNSMILDGGTGVNTLTLNNTTAGTGTTLDLTNTTVLGKVQNFSSIDITGPTSTATNNTLKLDWRAVSTLSGATDVTSTGPDESKLLVVNGNAGDTLNLVGLSSWSVGTSQTGASLSATFGSAYNFVAGNTYKAFTLNGATLFVNDAITVANAASSTTAFTPVTNAKTVLELFGPTFTDANMDQDFKGVAITSAGTTANVSAGLKYQFSTNGGSTWTDLAGGLTDSTAVFLAPNALIRFTDTSSGAVTAVPSVPLTARLVDTSGLTGTASLSSGNTVDASTNGGSTAFSGSPVTLSLLNRAPMSTDQDGVVVGDPFNSTIAGTFSNFTGNGTFAVGDGNSVTVSGNTDALISGTTIPGLFLGDQNLDETAKFEFASAIPSVQINVDRLANNAGTNAGPLGLEGTRILVNGQAFKLTTANLSGFVDGQTGAAVTPVLSTDGFLLTAPEGVIMLKGTITIPAGAVSGGITTLEVKHDFISGTPNGGFYEVLVPKSALTVDQLFGAYFSDADNNAFAGVMVNGAGTSAQQTSLGKYQFSTNNGSTWTDLASTTADTNAVYLQKSNLIRFVPTGSNGNAAKFDLSARLVDSSTANTFTAGNAVDVSGANNGGSTAVSGDTIVLRSSVQPNNAPVLTDGTLALAPVAEGSTANPTGAVGSLVSSLTGNINDPDGALVPEGIAITGVDTTKGTLFFSLNGGTTWTQVTQTLSNTNALLLAADGDNRVYFKPATGVTGSVASALTIRGWDKTSGTEGGLADTSTNGGITAFSTATDTVSLNLTKASLTASNVVNGTFTNERFGSVLSNVGDVNGDGFDDFIVGTDINTTPEGRMGAYVVFGSSVGITAQVAGAASTGFKIFSADGLDHAGAAVSGIGDVNGDGLADLLVGARDFDVTVNGVMTENGRSYIVYGKTDFAAVGLGSLGTGDTAKGRSIIGSGSMLNTGDLLVGAGDVNGDGIADAIVNDDMNSAGKYYVTFGNSASTAINLSAVAAGTGGYTITADKSNKNINNVGDINGDGLADMIVGVPTTTIGGKANAGKAYVVFGQSSGTAINVTELTAGTSSKGYVINGNGLSNENFGTSVSGAGDVNGDGIADVILGDNLFNAYVVFGKTGGAAIEASNLGASGFKIAGIGSTATVSTVVNYAGDINGDGLADVIVAGQTNNKAFVVFGKTDSNTVQISDVSAGKGGFVINAATDSAGFGSVHYDSAATVSYAGDLNGDGFDDLLVGARASTVSGNTQAGKTYVIYGGSQFSGVAAVLGTGTASDELVQGTQTADTLNGGGGVDRINAGAGSDTIVLRASDAANLAATTGGLVRASVDGGTGFDSLRLSGGMSLDLTTISNVSAMSVDSNSRLERLERIDMATDTAANTLTLASRDVNDMSGFNLIRTGSVSADGKTWTNVSTGTALSATTRFHQLVVDGGSSDVVNLKSGSGTWANAGTVNDGTNDYVVWQNTATTSQVLVRSGVTVNSNVAPVVLDLNRDGQFDYSRVLMDANSDGTLDSVLWAGQQDGVLVWDKYHDGQVHNHSQYAFTLYGGNTDLEGLAAGFDTNHDGMFSLQDEKFAEFKVWQDKNQDGVVDSGEMRSLNDLGIASIDLVSDGVQRKPVDGVEEAGRSSATTTDGQSILVADASFEFTTANPPAMDFVNGKAPYEFTPEELATILPQLEQVSEPGVYSLSLGQSLDLGQLVGAGHAAATALAQIEMASDTSANVLSLSLKDVLSLPTTDGVHQLKVTGAANDKLMLAEGDWTDSGAEVEQGGHRYALYTGTTDSTAQLLIDQQILQSHQSN